MDADGERHEEEGARKGMLSPIGGLINAIAQRIAQSSARDQQTAETNKHIAGATKAVALWTFLLAAVSMFSVAVLFLQWRTLDKTDRTLREGERAFVYLQALKVTPISESGWAFIADAINNGTTQTINLTYNITCISAIGSSAGIVMTSVLGPKQNYGLGACRYPSETLALNWAAQTPFVVKGTIFYQDVFGHSHVTIFCRHLRFLTDPRINTSNLRETDGFCPEDPDCADKECDKKF